MPIPRLFDELYAKDADGDFLRVYGIEGTPDDGDVPTWVAANSRLEFMAAGGGGGGVSDGDKGDIVVSASGTVWTIDTNVVTDSKLRQGVGTSVIGRSAGSTGNVADIVASGNGQVLRRAGGVLGFGAVDLTDVNAVSGQLLTSKGGTGLNTSSAANGKLLIGNGSGLTLANLTAGANISITNTAGGITIAAVAGAGGGGDTFQIYDADRPEDSPSAEDNEFDSSIADFTQVNWQSGGANMTYDLNTTRPGALYVAVTATGGQTHRALLKSIPAGDFTIQTQLVMGWLLNNFMYAGLLLADGTTNGAGNQCCWALYSAAYAPIAQTGVNFSGFNTNKYTPTAWQDHEIVLTIRRVGTNYFFAASPEGRTRYESNAITLAFTPTHMGIFVLNNTASAGSVSFLHFRYNSSPTYLFGGLRTVVGS